MKKFIEKYAGDFIITVIVSFLLYESLTDISTLWIKIFYWVLCALWFTNLWYKMYHAIESYQKKVKDNNDY